MIDRIMRITPLSHPYNHLCAGIEAENCDMTTAVHPD